MIIRNPVAGIAVLTAFLACSASPGKPRETTAKADCTYDCQPADKAPVADAKPAPGGAKTLGPAGEKAQLLREAADQVEKAAAALAGGNRSLAEQLFSTAELLVGPDALGSIAPLFRDGAPPRVTTPTQKIDPHAPPQPRVAGSSEAEDEADKVPPPPASGTLTGSMQIDGKTAAGAFGLVTLEPAGGKWKPRAPKHHVIEQRMREFLPHVMAISVGSTVSFPNFDTVFHNVFSTSPLGAFDLGLYKAGEAREYMFPKQGIIRVGCNLHANMSAYIAVVSAPAYVVTDDKGAFSFKRLAPGKYKLRAWSEKSRTPITQDITIKAGKNEVSVGVTGDAPAGPQPDKFGGKRG
jgi:plastocyanin